MNVKHLSNRIDSCKRIFSFLLLAYAILSSQCSIATPFFFPDMDPLIVKGSSPVWLKEGHGGDGYITVTSEIIPISSCSQLSSRNFWGADKTQLVVSVVTNGFKTKLDKVEIPIATFDGREGGSECSSLSALPLQIVPMTTLASYSIFNPGNLSLVLNVKSSNDSNQDFIGSAKLLLGAAAMVATGGSTAVIGGISATVGNSVLTDTQAKANSLLKGMIDAKVPMLLNWDQLRNGIEALEISVYRADQSVSNLTNEKIQQLQKDSKAEKLLLFKVKLTFQYFRTMFYPTVQNINMLGDRESLASEYILNYKVAGAAQNFMQILNNSVPSLLQKIGRPDTTDLTRACSEGFEKLRVVGLNNVDMAIVMKAFVDEAKGNSDWYSNPVYVKSCFGQSPSIYGYLLNVYGEPITQKQVIKIEQQ